MGVGVGVGVGAGVGEGVGVGVGVGVLCSGLKLAGFWVVFCVLLPKPVVVVLLFPPLAATAEAMALA